MAKEKSRRTADRFPCAYESGRFETIRAAILIRPIFQKPNF